MTVLQLDPTGAAEYFFAGARDAGLSHVVLSPGSRSTPLTVAVARTPDLDFSIELDERVAAFVALGRAKASGKAVGLVCTSGTAAANYLPAIAEASLSNVALVIITADRPPEHQHWGVGQSFDQRGLYHRQVRAEITMPVGGSAGADHALRAGWRATATAIEQHGPVHVNWAFRMPLEPVADAIRTRPTLAAVTEPESHDPSGVTAAVDAFTSASRPLIVAGPGTVSPSPLADHAASTLDSIIRSSHTLGIPILADVLSGLHGRGESIDGADTVVAQHALVTASSTIPSPDLIIHLGHTPTAKSTRLWWETLDCDHVLVDPLDEWQDASHLFSRRIRCTPKALLDGLTTSARAVDPSWVDSWRILGEQTQKVIDAVLDEWPSVTEAHIARSLSRSLTASDRVVASSSMPVRDMDTFAASLQATTIANRGINGIDGVVSTALGIHQSASAGRTVVLVGDIASIHDVGGILAAARSGQSLTIVIPNNDGGGIFSFLPIRGALDGERFEELFHTPHGTTFDFLAGHENISYVSTLDVEDALRSTLGAPGVTIIEVSVDTADRLDLQTAVTAAVAASEMP